MSAQRSTPLATLHGAARLAVPVLATVVALSACAPFQVWRKCGAGCPGDASLGAAVRARLNEHTALLAPNEVDVRVLDGVIYLSGQVATDLQRETAESVAGKVQGVVRVVNSIALTFGGR